MAQERFHVRLTEDGHVFAAVEVRGKATALKAATAQRKAHATSWGVGIEPCRQEIFYLPSRSRKTPPVLVNLWVEIHEIKTRILQLVPVNPKTYRPIGGASRVA